MLLRLSEQVGGKTDPGIDIMHPVSQILGVWRNGSWLKAVASGSFCAIS